jgi:hypothetical protein
MEPLNKQFNWANPGAAEVFWLYMEDNDDPDDGENTGDSNNEPPANTSFDHLLVFREGRLFKVGDPNAEQNAEFEEADAEVQNKRKKNQHPLRVLVYFCIALALATLGWAIYNRFFSGH